MKLYVHYEHRDTKWTKRLNIVSATASLQRVLELFRDLFVAKFDQHLDLAHVSVFTERHQNESTRRLIPTAKYCQTLQQLGICLPVESGEGGSGKATTCDVELVVSGVLRRREGLSNPDSRQRRSPPPYSDVGMRGMLDIALTHFKERRHRAAREAYETLVLSVDPTHPEALLGLGEIYFSIDKFDVAATKYFNVCWETHSRQPQSRAYALVAFTSALKLVECQLHLRKFRAALATLDELQRFLRRHSKCRSFFCDALDKERMEAQMDYLRACALYDLNTPAEQETAISLLMHLLPDLQDPAVNLDALQLYARVAKDRGRKNEALSMLLRVLVGKSTDPTVRRQLVELLKGKNGMERLLYSVPTTTPSAAAAYAFTATILKDFGAVDSSARCFEHALSLTPKSAAYALNLAHALEVCNRYEEAYDSLLRFLRNNRSLTVLDTLSASQVLELLGSHSWHTKHETASSSLGLWSMIWKIAGGEGFAEVRRDGSPYKLTLHNNTSSPPRRDMSDDELDLLACFFTMAKILFVNGRIHVLPGLVAVLEPLRLGRQLHKTSIRNEQAYYLYIAQLLCVEPNLAMPSFVESDKGENDPADSSPEPPTFVCGDSHTLATAWRTICLDGSTIQLRPALVTGLKHWHLRRESDFYPKVNFWNVLNSLPHGSRVVFLFGEIDCREGILQAVELCKYETVQEGMEHTIQIFMDTLAEVVAKCGFEVFIHPVVPVLNETRHLVLQYNKIFQTKVASSKLCKWLDFFDELLEGTPEKLRPEYALDGTHLHPRYLRLLERELAKAVVAQ